MHRGISMWATSSNEHNHCFHFVSILSETWLSLWYFKRVASCNNNFPGKMLGPRNRKGSYMEATVLSNLHLVMLSSRRIFTSKKNASDIILHLMPIILPSDSGQNSTSISFIKSGLLTTNLAKLNPLPFNISVVQCMTANASLLFHTDFKQSSI